MTGHRRISRFIASIVRPLVLTSDLAVAYRPVAKARKAEALQRAEAVIGDAADEVQ